MGSSTLEDISQTVDIAEKNSKNLSQASNNLGTIQDEMNKLNNILTQNASSEIELADKLSETSQNTEEVKNVLTVISDIADQTNLLVLNYTC